MMKLTNTGAAPRMMQVVMFNFIASMFIYWLTTEDQRWKSALTPLISVLLAIDAALIWWLTRNRDFAPSTITLVYLLSLAYGIIWTVTAFAWWKMMIVIVPLVLATARLRDEIRRARCRTEEESQ